MNRWRINKLGFVNFWLYDRQEFPIEDGHILMRGANASGKSITTQSFIPFLLDGDKSPSRLDPFGSTARRMEYYLLGEDEREESTGYLYLEWKKDGVEEYLTIGAGMRAQKGKPVDFWGFCLCDGRRIGSGFRLYETAGSQMLPLSKAKLRNLLNNDDCLKASPTEYKQMVNNKVFGFRDIRQYEQLIQLLIKVRTPKLSKDFRPSDVKKVLNESLPVLTEEDLSAMASTMSEMDTWEETLGRLRTAQKSAAVIRNEYNRYNQFVLGKKAEAFLDARADFTRKQTNLRDLESRLDEQQKEFLTQEQLRGDALVRLKQAQAQRTAMGDDDISAQKRRLEEERASSSLLQKQIKDAQLETDAKKDSIRAKEVELRDCSREQRDIEAECGSLAREIKERNAILLLGEDYGRYAAPLDTGRAGEPEFSAVRTLLSKRKKRIQQNRECFSKVKLAEDEHDAACRELDEATLAVNHWQSEMRDAEQLVQEERDTLLEAIARRQSINAELRFSEEELLSLRQAVLRYRSPADWNTMQHIANTRKEKQHGILAEKMAQAKQELQNNTQEARRLEDELSRLRAQAELTPPRSGQTEAARAFLCMQSIPHAAFYEAVDFAPGLSQEQRDLLEAQLADSGLLDALLVPEEAREQLTEILREYPDRFLLPGEPVQAPLTALVADETNRFHALAAQCLRGISCSDADAQTAFLPDGSYRVGMLHGQSRAEFEAGFVGGTARRANHERQIQALTLQVENARARERDAREAESALAKRLSILQEEFDRMPTPGELSQALDASKANADELKKAEGSLEETVRKESAARQALTRLKQESRELSEGLPYARTMEAYEEAEDAADEFESSLTNLQISLSGLQSKKESIQHLKDHLDELRERLDQLEKSIRRDTDSLAIATARISEIEAVLNLPENQERARRIGELEQEIKTQEEALQNARDACIRLEADICHSTEGLAENKKLLENALFKERELECYFSEDLALGYAPFDAGEALSYAAEQAKAAASAMDRDRTPEKAAEALQNCYQKNISSLLEYNPKIETVFEPPAQPGMLRQRTAITLQRDGRWISLYVFLDSLQQDIDLTETVLEEKDRELFERVLTDTITKKLRGRIEDSQIWSARMSSLMKTLDTSMGLQFSLEWSPKKAEGQNELDTALLVSLLNKGKNLLTDEDSKRISAHFRAKVAAARQEAAISGTQPNYTDLIRDALDYRAWHEFHIFYQREGEGKKELTDRIFNKFSGGEKAMAIYQPQFAALSAQYSRGGPHCPTVLALDEAFAGVDDKNIEAMFELVRALDFDYIMNSQALWGCYSCVTSLDIADFHRPANAQVVTILHYRWNGVEKILLEEPV